MHAMDGAPAADAGTLKVHPLADLFSMLPADELRALADDIAAHGLRRPIVIDDQDRIIDGRNRQAACELAGVKPVYEPFVGTEKEVAAYIASENLHRRHLTPSQRASIAASMANMSRGGDRRGDQTATLQNGEPEISQSEAAEIMGVSERSVAKAAKVRKKGTKKLQAAVAAGEVSVNRASQIADLPKPEQNKAVSGYFDKMPKPFVERWDALFGPLVRHVDDAARAAGTMNSVQHRRCLDLLSKAAEEYKAVRPTAA